MPTPPSTPTLGLGCWPLSGPMYFGDLSIGYATTDPADAPRIIHAALDHGITIFDTAAAYGAGRGERIVGDALKGREATIITKIGLDIDEGTQRITGENTDPAAVSPAIDAALSRLGRDHIDTVLLHLNSLAPDIAAPIFDALEAEVTAGRIGGYGWSTDYPDNAASLSGRHGLTAIEHCMNVFFDAHLLREAAADQGLSHYIRSPLAMGLLAGRFDANSGVAPDDVRASDQSWMDYFDADGNVTPEFAGKLEAVRELLQTGGRTLAQGALGWLWAHGTQIVPVPGASKVAQVEDNAGALSFGPLPEAVMTEIATLIPRDLSPPRDR
ncbi:MAG: aldo/keto reductase [Pseudomonadota bacterium]